MNVMPASRLGFLFLGIAASLNAVADVRGQEQAPEVVRIMSFNLWNGGDSGKLPLDQTIAVIREARADIVGLQETAGFAPDGMPRPDRAAEIAKRLGWHYLDQGNRTGIISRFKIIDATPEKWGARLETPSGRQLYLFNIHLAASPYQPYQLLRIPYGDHPFLNTAEEAVRAAKAARGGSVERMLAELKTISKAALPVFLTGDFNEPSHLDWTAAAADAKLCPMEVAWPATRAVVAAGFVDAYRAIHPDPIEHRGLTWTPTTRPDDPKDRHDRIDFTFVRDAKVKAAVIVGEAPRTSDIVVTPYPSDHRAVVAEVEWTTAGPAETSAPRG